MWFLSNETEAALLVTDAYQEKLVRAVYLGAITYLESGKTYRILPPNPFLYKTIY